MPSLKGTKTHQNLKDAFAGESQANRRYLYFAKVADVEGQPEIAGLFRDTAEGETGHAHGHLDYLKTVGDPATDLPIGDSLLNLKSRGSRRDLRVHRHVPRDGEDRARRGFSPKSPTGSRPWPRLKSRTRAASTKRRRRSN